VFLNFVKKKKFADKKKRHAVLVPLKKSNRFYFHTQQSVAEARIFTSRIGIIIFAAANKMALFLFIKKIISPKLVVLNFSSTKNRE